MTTNATMPTITPINVFVPSATEEEVPATLDVDPDDGLHEQRFCIKLPDPLHNQSADAIEPHCAAQACQQSPPTAHVVHVELTPIGPQTWTVSFRYSSDGNILICSAHVR